MSEEYIERLIIRQDIRPEVETPSFTNEDVDANFKFDGTLKLVQIVKSVQNAAHNRHDYVFQVVNIIELEKEV